MSRVRVHIDRLVLPAHMAGDAARLSQSLREAIAAEVGKGTALSGNRSIERIDGGVTRQPSATLGTVAAAIGKALR